MADMGHASHRRGSRSVMKGENPTLRDLVIKGDSHPAAQNDGERRTNKRAKLDDAMSTVTSDSLTSLHKKLHFPNNLMTVIPKRSDRAFLPPPRSKWLDIHTQDSSMSCASAFFIMKNDWGLIKKWEKMKDLPATLYVGEKVILRIPNIPDIEHLLYEVCYLNRFIEEEFLVKVGLSFQAWRCDARILKKSSKFIEPSAPASKVSPKRQARGDDPQALLKKKRLERVARLHLSPPLSSCVFMGKC
ncbi:hypothetical protein IEQ34_020428 [Dendrobium chrysotoxum]|uniref:Uncharacterized protein n=1 Tax=Dendrobium chrysotoxum TaxID=161865 RepID=A0AAV7G0X0_DENCH|nr:hypothetical protein IEQ34_020428 [Dendrobium chrysotoxum]